MPGRGWRVALTGVAVLLGLQAGAGALCAGLGLLLLPAPAADATVLPGAEEFLPGGQLPGPMTGLLWVAVWVGLVLSLVLLMGAVGLLRRRKWGWYAVTVTQVLGAGGLFAVLPAVFGAFIELAAPGSWPLLPWALSLLAVLPALGVVGFLLLGPVLRQFEPTEPREQASPA